MVAVSFVLCSGSGEDVVTTDGDDEREQESEPERRRLHLHRSASVPARHEGEPQRLNAPSLSARGAHFSTISVAASKTWKRRVTCPAARASRTTSRRPPSGEKPAAST